MTQNIIIILLIAVLVLEIIRISESKLLAHDNLILESLVRILATAKLGGTAHVIFDNNGVSMTYMPEGEDESVGQYDGRTQV